MKKILKGLICAGICGVITVGALGMAGCDKSEHRDPESSKSALKLAIGAVDQNFNPLFYTSQNDGVIANMTQASLVSADASGKLAYGENYPTVALDYKETYLDASRQQVGTSNGRDKINGSSDANGYTTYEFLIKNGMKFSDGYDLTVMDVLFNLYVYLDPAYSGSSTIYSTKITGLQKYMKQDANASDDDPMSYSQYYSKANERIDELIRWATASNDDGTFDTELDENGFIKNDSDLKTVCDLYWTELNSDWNSIETSWVESYKEKYRFTDAWQVFFYEEGLVTKQKTTGEYGDVDRLDSDGKYLTTLDPEGGVEGAAVAGQMLIEEIEDATTPAEIAKYRAEHPNVSEADALNALKKNAALKHVYSTGTIRTQIDDVLTYTATAGTVFNQFVLEAMSDSRGDGPIDFPRIDGITVSRSNEFNGRTYETEHDILKIEIKGVDPKAKWNFGFAVAPMHYYSDKAHYNAAYGDEDSDYKSGRIYNGTATNFGVEYGDADWFKDVLKNSAKNGVPIGAGPYKCCTSSFGNIQADSNGLYNYLDFYDNNIAHFERNDQFTTMGSGINNAKIKYVTYKVTRDDQIVSALKAKEIDYGEPLATSRNQSDLNTGTLKQKRYLAGGYGYVGINPKYVPDIEVRKAIMHALDTSSIIEYYGESLVNLINRPISTTSWAYPDGATRYYEQVVDEQGGLTAVEQIQEMINKEGNWELSGGKYYSTNDGRPLKITFTLAGESYDHPAYNMFVEASRLLNSAGFDVSVTPDIKALQKLTSGDLEVWAAAWSSSIDPDPYQIYSMNSNATSTNNWYKTGILRSGPTGNFATEYGIVTSISDLIDAGRSTLDEDKRADIYSDCFDLIMELAVEFPTYQRYELCVYNAAAIDENSLTKNPSHNMGPIDELWKVAYKK